MHRTASLEFASGTVACTFPALSTTAAMQALLELEWPAQLLTTKAAGEEWAQQDAVVSETIHGQEQHVVFRGLRVRMGAHTGNNCTMSRHPVTGASQRAPLACRCVRLRSFRNQDMHREPANPRLPGSPCTTVVHPRLMSSSQVAS